MLKVSLKILLQTDCVFELSWTRLPMIKITSNNKPGSTQLQIIFPTLPFEKSIKRHIPAMKTNIALGSGFPIEDVKIINKWYAEIKTTIAIKPKVIILIAISFDPHIDLYVKSNLLAKSFRPKNLIAVDTLEIPRDPLENIKLENIQNDSASIYTEIIILTKDLKLIFKLLKILEVKSKIIVIQTS